MTNMHIHTLTVSVDEGTQGETTRWVREADYQKVLDERDNLRKVIGLAYTELMVGNPRTGHDMLARRDQAVKILEQTGLTLSDARAMSSIISDVMSLGYVGPVVCSTCGANNGEHGEVDGQLCPVAVAKTPRV